MICKYLLLFSRLSSLFDDFHHCVEDFWFDVVPFAYFCFYFPCLWNQIHKNTSKMDVSEAAAYTFF